MIKYIYLMSSILFLNAVEEKLVKFKDGSIWCITTYKFNGEMYNVEFDTNANIGTVSSFNEPIAAWIEHNKVTSCKDMRNTDNYQIQLAKQTYGPEFLKVFMAAKDDFATKSKNHT